MANLQVIKITLIVSEGLCGAQPVYLDVAA